MLSRLNVLESAWYTYKEGKNMLGAVLGLDFGEGVCPLEEILLPCCGGD